MLDRNRCIALSSSLPSLVPFGQHVVNVAMHDRSLAFGTPLGSRHSVTGCYLPMDALFEAITLTQGLRKRSICSRLYSRTCAFMG